MPVGISEGELKAGLQGVWRFSCKTGGELMTLRWIFSAALVVVFCLVAQIPLVHADTVNHCIDSCFSTWPGSDLKNYGRSAWTSAEMRRNMGRLPTLNKTAPMVFPMTSTVPQRPTSGRSPTVRSTAMAARSSSAFRKPALLLQQETMTDSQPAEGTGAEKPKATR
jgi:hypothetical protein